MYCLVHILEADSRGFLLRTEPLVVRLDSGDGQHGRDRSDPQPRQEPGEFQPEPGEQPAVVGVGLLQHLSALPVQVLDKKPLVRDDLLHAVVVELEHQVVLLVDDLRNKPEVEVAPIVYKLVRIVPLRPALTIRDGDIRLPDRPVLHPHAAEQAEIEIKYEGYLKKQEAQVREMRRLEEMPIPEDFDYAAQRGLRLEAVEKLRRIRPANIGQASRISGVSPADISVLVILLRRG